jgi:3-oxoacyl-(acyl-carrier-protein) synthase/surfactin synthase thioesterase subunit/acyl carrier protein
MTSETTTTLQKAWYTITQLKQLLKNQELRLAEPIAIIGLGCRVPGAQNKEEYWKLLTSGKNIISILPEERWKLLQGTDEFAQRDNKHLYLGGFLPKITEFDAYFFGISPREAMHMDPQQRLLLEVSYEAIEDAGISLESLAGSKTGVFASLYASQFPYVQKLETDMDALFIPTGSATSIAANRLSYIFDLQGPSIVIDTACSSSLVALHTAVLSLQNNMCDTAIVMAANINLFPSTNLILSKAKMLSPDGQCKTFDAGANGYVQGEGAGAIILKPLSKAIEDKDRIYAVIASSGVNQDGKTNGLTAPNGMQQEKLIQSIYAKAKINPQDISYIECHGTGTFLGDPIEIQALGEVVGKNRTAENPCWIGSVKTNIGHLEPAAGVASLIKVALSLQHSKIPPHLNVTKPNPLLELSKYHLRIPEQLEDWPKYGNARMAGISGFGFGGTNAHVLLRETHAEETFPAVQDTSDKPEVFTLSAKDPNALSELVNSWVSFLENNTALPLSQICYNAHIRRSHYFFRLAIIAKSTSELLAALASLKRNKNIQTETIFTADAKNKIVTDSDLPKKISDMDLASLARAYVNHANLNWPQYEEKRRYPLIEMPRYPWQHKSYWPSLGNHENQIEKAEISLYPFQGRLIQSPLNALQFEFRFDTQVIPEILDTYNILHAGYYLEMLAFATDKLSQKIQFTVENLSFSSPIIVSDNQTTIVQLVLDKANEDGRMNFTFFSSTDEQKIWKEHTKGTLLLATSPHKKIDSIILMKQRSRVNQDSEEFYSRVRSMDMPADGSIRWTQQYWLGDKEILCELDPPAFAVIDACIQGLFLALPQNLIYPYVASQIGELKYYGMKGNSLYLYSTLNEVHPNGDDYQGDWFLINERDEVIAECKNIRMKRLTHTVKLDRIRTTKEQIEYDWAPLTQEKRKQKIISYLSEQVALIFSMPVEDVDILRSLNEMGMDSLMALVLMRSIETGLGVTYSMQSVLQGPSIAEIADFVLAEKQKQIDQKQKPEIGIVANAIAKVSTPWIAYRQTPEHPEMRLFCFPYGGGGASIYRKWSTILPNNIEVCPIQLPGREDRLEELPMRDMSSLIDILIEILKNELDLPFAFFGHSFGSLIAFELTRRLRKLNMPLPTHLFFSAYPEPSIPTRSLDNLISHLKRADVDLFELDNQSSVANVSSDKLNMIVEVFNTHGIAEYGAHTMNAKAIKLLLPIFIADMKIVSTYHYHEEAPLDIPMTVFLGKEDIWVPPADLKGWKKESSVKCDFYEINSGHMFIRNDEYIHEVLQQIGKYLNSSCNNKT